MDRSQLTPEQQKVLSESGLTPEQQDQLAEQWGQAAAQREQASATGQAPPAGPQVPKLDHNPETPEEVSALAREFAEYRREISELREELRASRVSPKFLTAVEETPDDRLKARLAAIAEATHYCPGCGNLGKYPQKCNGLDASRPHPPIEMVVTDELSGDPQGHTKAPDAAPEGLSPSRHLTPAGVA